MLQTIRSIVCIDKWQDDSPMSAPEDGRLLRGARSRQTILRHAVDVASLEGLTGLTIGRLATDLGVSKSNVQTLFGTKENLQIATAEFAREAFLDAVVRPAMSASPGAPRLRALTEAWLAYAEKPLFPGGCFWAANLPDFDSRPGPVRDTLARHQRDWRALIARELTVPDPDLTAFQIDAVLTATNIALRLGDKHAAANARRVIETLTSA
jgi:AcrR family transcriptional regulator